MLKTCILGVLLALSGAANAGTVIYDNFNADEENVFDCCHKLVIAGGQTNAKSTVAVPFTPEVDGRVTGVEVPLSFIGGGYNELLVKVVGSENGNPGRTKHLFRAQDLPGPGQCCVFQSLEASGVLVQGGGHYWIEVVAQHDNMGGWNLNTTGASGAYKAWDGHAWVPVSDTLPALRITVR